METLYHNDDTGLEWLFAQAREYPLLTAVEEAAIDARKWRAIDDLQLLFLADDAIRAYLARWTQQLLETPPTANNVRDRQHGRLLKRDLSAYLPGKPLHEALQAFHRALNSEGDATPRATIKALQLPAALVAGLGELFSGEPTLRGVAAALQHWQTLWNSDDDFPLIDVAATTRRGIRQRLRDYDDARTALVNHNLRLVFSIGNRLGSRNVAYRDLVQEGIFGLMRAAEKFQSSRGYRFSTYAYNWITQSMRRALADQDGIVRLPTQVMEQVGRLHRERMQHIDRTGNEPAARELAQRLNLPLADVEELRTLGNLGLSLETPHSADPDGDINLGSTLAGGPFGATAEAAEQRSLRRSLKQRLQQLKPAERNVIVSRWGLENRQPLSRAEIGLQMGVSAERVRQLEVAALQTLRQDRELLGTYLGEVGEEG